MQNKSYLDSKIKIQAFEISNLSTKESTSNSGLDHQIKIIEIIEISVSSIPKTVTKSTPV